jgi:hypothetical protein
MIHEYWKLFVRKLNLFTEPDAILVPVTDEKQEVKLKVFYGLTLTCSEVQKIWIFVQVFSGCLPKRRLMRSKISLAICAEGTMLPKSVILMVLRLAQKWICSSL